MVYIRAIFSIILSLILFLSPAMAVIPIPNADNFIEVGNENTDGLKTSTVVSVVDESINEGFTSMLVFLYSIGVLVAVCVLAFMGVKFLVAPSRQKAQIKDSLLPYSIGLLLFLAGVPIAILIINIFLDVL